MEDINGCLESDVWLFGYTEKRYGCHRPQMPRYQHKPIEQVCVYCRQRQPLSLEDLAFYKVLKDAELVQKVDTFLSHIPDRLFAMIGRVINANYYSKALKLVDWISGDRKPRPSTFDVKPGNQILLTQFLFYSSVYRKLKPYYKEDSPGVISEMLQYARGIGTDYKDFWCTMNALTREFDEVGRKEEENLLIKDAPADGSNVVYVNTSALIGRRDEPTVWKVKLEYKAMKDLQKRNKTTACPVIFRPSCIAYPCLKARDIQSLLDDINPQDITEIDLGVTASWSVEKIRKLGQVLSSCTNLSSISLWQTTANTESPEDLAQALSELFGSHHAPLLKLRLGGIPLGGTLEQYPLPPAEEWCLSGCNIVDTDWKFMAGRADLGLKALTLASEYQFHFDLLRFIQAQAASLERLSLQDLVLAPDAVCDLLNGMAQFNTLQKLHVNCDDMDATCLEKLIVAFMSIRSAKKLFCEMSTMRIYNEKKEHLEEAMKKFCSDNRRPPICLSTIVLSPLHVTTRSIWDD